MENLQKLFLPIAIIIAGIAIAYAVYHSGSSPAAVKTDPAKVLGTGTVAPVTDVDHIRGSKDAKLVIVEYSDTECPYCKNYNESLKRIYSDYASSSKVAWVYRSFPLSEIHAKAPKEAEALECADELGGSDIFWDYTDMIYSVTPSNDGLEPSELANIADRVGLDKKAFQACLDGGKYAAKVAESRNAAIAAMGDTPISTPFTVFLLKTAAKTETIPLVDANGESLGALPYDSLKAVVEKLINS